MQILKKILKKMYLQNGSENMIGEMHYVGHFIV